MRTKSIDIKACQHNWEAIEKVSFYADSPYIYFQLAKWLSEADKNDTLSLTSFEFFNENRREHEIENMIKLLQAADIEFTRTLIAVESYKGDHFIGRK